MSEQGIWAANILNVIILNDGIPPYNWPTENMHVESKRVACMHAEIFHVSDLNLLFASAPPVHTSHCDANSFVNLKY